MKFLTREGLSMTQEMIEVNTLVGIPMKVPGQQHSEVELDLSNNPYSFNACIDWLNIIRTDYSVPYYKIDVGEYIGLWPTGINSDGVVTFLMDQFDPRRKHWKDWFIVEKEIEYASK